MGESTAGAKFSEFFFDKVESLDNVLCGVVGGRGGGGTGGTLGLSPVDEFNCPEDTEERELVAVTECKLTGSGATDDPVSVIGLNLSSCPST